MRVFLSWSGDSSKAIARCLSRWLPHVLQAVEPWFSEEDIAPGSRWLQELLTNLKAQDFFIACVTAESLGSAWFVFEIGVAASKLLSDEDRQRVCPLLWKLENKDVPQPLGMFQTLTASEPDVLRLVVEMNGKLERPLSEVDLIAAFRKWWPDLYECLREIPDEGNVVPVRRQEDILEEILATVRQESANSGTAMYLLSRIQDDLNQLNSRLPTYSLGGILGPATIPIGTNIGNPSGLQLLLQSGVLGSAKVSSEEPKAGIGPPPDTPDTMRSGKPNIGEPPKPR